MIATGMFGSGRDALGATGEEHMLMLHNGGMVCGIMPQIGGRVVVFRTKTGANVLDGRPELWNDPPRPDLLATNFKQYYGESVWAGPQAVWWTADEPYPPNIEYKGPWPPDPAWEFAPFTIVEQTPTRVILRSPISKLTGLELTKTIELSANGQLTLQVKAVNRSDRLVTRDLWLLHRVSPTARTFLPLKSETTDKGFSEAVSIQKMNGLTVLELLPHEKSSATISGGKMLAVAENGWMATAVPEGFFTVRFQPTEAYKTAPGQAPVEIFFSSAPQPLCEMEHHGELTTLKPGETMETKETWQIIPYSGAPDAEAQSRFLQATEQASLTLHVQ